MEVRVHFTHSPIASSSSTRCSTAGSPQWLMLMHVWRAVGNPHGHGAIPAGVAAHFRAMHEKLPVMLQSGHIDWCAEETRGAEEVLNINNIF